MTANLARLLRAAALLAAPAALSACVTSNPPDPARPAAGGNPPAAGGGNPAPGAKEAGNTAVSASAKALLYQDIRNETDNWAAAHAEGGTSGELRAHGIETAVARVVWARFDEILADLQGSDNPRWRASAARGLGFVANEKARPALEKALADPDASVLAAALVSLARIADPDTDDVPVAKLLSYPDKVVQGDAALCLGRLFLARRGQGISPVSPPDRVEKIESDLNVLLFDGEDPIVRAGAARALGGLGSPRAEESLLNRLRDDHPLVRAQVAQALASAGSAKSVDPLLDALGREPEKNVQSLLALALGALAERDRRAPPYSDLGTDAAKWRQWLKK